MKNDLAIMYSGGLDSFIAYHYALKSGYNNPILIHTAIEHPYNKREQASMKGLQLDYITIGLDGLYGEIEKRMVNQIIPSRNVMLATIGSMFAPRVWVCALDGEQLGKENDKSERFYTDTTKLLSFTNEFFQDETIVETPFANMSKVEVVKWALENGVSEGDLKRTSSCYAGGEKQCGSCLTCYKRYIAMYLNGIVEDYETDPSKSEYALSMMNEILIAHEHKDYTRFTPKRIKEHFEYMDMRAHEITT